jgi:hypothetical protein
MKEYENLLKLIATGNPVSILQEPDLIPKFNELLKQELIEVREDKVVLTKKGEEVSGFKPVRPSIVANNEAEEFGEKARIKGKTFYLLSLFLLMISILFVLVVNN